MTRRSWIGTVGVLLVVAGLTLPRGWYDRLPRQSAVPDPPIKGVTLLQFSMVTDGLLLLFLSRRRMVVSTVPVSERPILAVPPGDGEKDAEDVLPVARSVAWWLVAALTAAGLALRLWRVGADLWLDEITPLQDYGSMSYLQVIASYYASNNHLLTTLLEKVSMAWFGESEWAVRLPAVIFGTATLPVFYGIARMTSSRMVSLSATLLLTVSYHHIFFSQNARGYSAYLFFSLLASGLFVRALETDRAALWGLYVAATVAGFAALLNTAFVFSAHVLVGVAAVAWVWRRRGTAPRTLVARLVVVFGTAAFLVFQLYATALPQAFVFIATTYKLRSGGSAPLSSDFIQEVVRGVAQAFAPGLLLGAVPFLLVAVGGFWMLLRRHLALTAALALPMVLTVAVLVAGGLTFSPRFFLLALPVAILAAVQGIYTAVFWAARAAGGRRRTAGLTATALVIAVGTMSVVPLRRYYSIPKQPYRAAINYAKTARSDNGIVIAIHLAERGVLYYGPRLGLRENEDFFLARTVERLDQILDSHRGRPAYLVTTLPRYLRIELPELEQRIARGWTIAKTFPATIGDGAISVWRPRARESLR